MKQAHYFLWQSIIVTSACSVALTFFALQSNWIIWRGPTSNLLSTRADGYTKHIILHYRQHGNAQQEHIQLVWDKDDQKNVHHLLNAWLTFLFDEECIAHKLEIETVMLNLSKQDVFISFNRKPFSKEQSIHEKIAFIEDLCTNLSCINTIKRVRFLVQHQQLSDPHLDFSASWFIKA